MMRETHDSLNWLNRSFAGAHRIVLYAGLAVLTAAPAQSANALSSDYMCHQVSVVDEEGRAIFGIEDMAHDVRHNRLILSAYDRFAATRAMENGMDPPNGGLHVLDTDVLMSLGDGDATVSATTLGVQGPGSLLLHPHGIDLFDDGEMVRLAVVNRLADIHDSSAADLLLFDVDGPSLTLIARGGGDAFCRANDVVLLDASTAIFSYDQSRCGAWGVWAERVFQPRRSGLRLSRFEKGKADAQSLLDDVAFANGVAVSPDGASLLMTGSRDRELRIYDRRALLEGGAEPTVIVPFDGGPDNISVTPDGRSITAVHPDPFALFLHINEWGDLPESRIVMTSADGTLLQTIEGPHGTMPGAATSALMLDDRIIVSSAWDVGLGVCRPVSSAQSAAQR